MRIIEDKPEFWPYLIISIAIHILLALFGHYYSPPLENVERIVEITPVIEPDGTKPARIADIDKPAVEKKPQQPKFLGMYDSAVDKEMVASGKVAEKAGEKGSKTPAEKTSKKEKPEKETPDKKLDTDKLYSLKKTSPSARSAKRGDDGDGISSGDFFPDFKVGSKTYLNVLRYPGVDYFVRMKRVFRTTFNPEPSLRSHFAMNQISRGSIEVVLGVSVNKQGGLSELFVFRSSGVPEYDEEALRTVRASSPFSSPPDKFVEKDGQLRMSWTFTVYL